MAKRNDSLYPITRAERRNFTVMRDMVQKRLKRARAKGIDLPDVMKISEMSSPIDFWAAQQYMEDLIYMGVEAYYQEKLRKDREEQKKNERNERTLDTLHEHGYNIDDLDAFGEFMDMFRATGIGRMYASDIGAEMYEAAEDQGIDLDELMENYDEYIDAMEAVAQGNRDFLDESDSSSIWEAIYKYVHEE